MAFVGILLWWYTDGWQQTIRAVRARLVSLFDYFSIDILLRTLFSPFRQISAGNVEGAFEVKLRAFADQLVSRMVGGTVRFIVMIVGLVTILLSTIGGALYIILWAFMPLAPIIGLIMTLIGWIPWTIV